MLRSFFRPAALVLAAILLLCCFSGCGGPADDTALLLDASNNAVAAALSEPAHAPAGCTASRYDMVVALDTEKNTASGYEDVQIKNTSEAALSEICFRYYAPAISPKSAVTQIAGASGSAYTLRFENDKTCVFADLGKEPLAPGETRTLRVSFSTVIPKKNDRFGYRKDKNGKIFMLTFWAPQLAMFADGRWNDSPYFDEGESTYNAMADYTVRLTAPESYVIAASGTQTVEGGVTVIDAPNVREMAIIACDYMTVETRMADGVTLKMYRTAEEQFQPLFDLMLENAAAAISLYNEKIGSYLYTELDIVPGYIYAGGMEMPGLVIEALPKKMSADFYYQAAVTVAHEVAHQWFYCAVGNDQYREPWLDESFATYCETYLYQLAAPEALKHVDRLTFGDEKDVTVIPTRENLAQTAGSITENGSHAINLPCSAYSTAGYGAYVYNAGGAFLFELQQRMGDDVFYEMLSQWYLSYRLHEAHGCDFIKHVLQYDDSDAVKDIINRYLSEENL